METKKIKVKTLAQKLAMNYGVKTMETKSVKQVDMENRIIKGIASTYYFIDSDFDMLIPGVAKKSIKDRGPQSDATAKIKLQSDHVLNTKNVVGRLTVLDERQVDGLEVLYFEAHLADTTKGNDDLVNYQDEIYDNHSIGFIFKNLIWASKDSEDELSRAAWDEFFPLAINPDKADEIGGFWVIKEIALFELSVVSYGANSLTANLTGKSKDGEDKIKVNLFERMDELNRQLKSNAETKGMKSQIDMEFRQVKQIITEMKLEQPSKKDTPSEPSNDDTDENVVSKKSFIQIISKT